MIEDETAEDMIRIYENVYDLIGAEFIQGTDPLAVAGVLAATALRIYRTTLSEEDFEKATAHIYSSRHNIRPFGDQVTLQ